MVELLIDSRFTTNQIFSEFSWKKKNDWKFFDFRLDYLFTRQFSWYFRSINAFSHHVYFPKQTICNLKISRKRIEHFTTFPRMTSPFNVHSVRQKVCLSIDVPLEIFQTKQAFRKNVFRKKIKIKYNDTTPIASTL